MAADNATAMRLYQRSGYAVVKRTDQGAACNCVASRVFKWFLGHPGGPAVGSAVGDAGARARLLTLSYRDGGAQRAGAESRCPPAIRAAVWVKMHKALPAPEHLAACKPEPACIELAATAGEASFVNVPLESGAACQAGQQERPAADKASLGCWPGSRQPRPAAAVAGVAAAAGGDEMVAPAGAHAAVPAATSTSLPSSPRRSFLRKLSGAGAELGPQASQVTPRIAAVGGATAAAAAHQQLDARGQESGRRLTADARAASASAKESDYTVLSLSAAPPAKPLAVTAVPVGSSLASMSVESDSDSEEEEDNPRALHAAQQGAASSADVFQLVELSAGSAALFPPAPA